MRLLLGTFILVWYIYSVSDLYSIVANTVVRHGYKLRFAFGYGSDNQISFIHGRRIYVYLYCLVVNFNYLKNS